jgi:hypothetical protein
MRGPDHRPRTCHSGTAVATNVENKRWWAEDRRSMNMGGQSAIQIALSVRIPNKQSRPLGTPARHGVSADNGHIPCRFMNSYADQEVTDALSARATEHYMGTIRLLPESVPIHITHVHASLEFSVICDPANSPPTTDASASNRTHAAARRLGRNSAPRPILGRTCLSAGSESRRDTEMTAMGRGCCPRWLLQRRGTWP